MLELTKAFIACTSCPESFENDDGIMRSVETAGGGSVWVPPRGWAGSPVAEHRPFIIVALNPGSPMPQEPVELREAGVVPPSAGTTVSDATSRILLDYATTQFLRPGSGQHFIFHKKTVGYARMLMWLLRECDERYSAIDPLNDDWREFVWITDAFKCSTLIENGPKIPSSLMLDCLRRHFAEEHRVLTPRVTLAMGGKAAKALEKAGFANIGVRHPSNGCSACDHPRHDGPLSAVAQQLGHPSPSEVATSSRFRSFRGELQSQLFP